VEDLLAGAALVHQFERDVVILEAPEARAQRRHLDREAEAHLEPRVAGAEVRLVGVQRALHHVEGEGLLRVTVEAAHEPAHVDALLGGIERDGPRHGGFEKEVAPVAQAVADRQAEARDADVLDRRASTPDQRFGSVLEVRHRRSVERVGFEGLGVDAREVWVVRHLAPR
jgi:hypothetical protein